MFHASACNLMGTRLDVVMIGVRQGIATALWQSCLDIVSHLETVGSRFSPDSETSAVNRAEPLSMVSVSPLFRGLLTDAIGYRTLTLGAFDITACSCAAVDFTPDGLSLIIPSSGLKIDLGGYLKGHAVDLIADTLRQGGVTDAFIDFGGSSIMGIGSHPAGDGWPVSVTDPYTRRSLRAGVLRDAALSTSGNTPAYNGHIVSPFTGRAVTGNRLSAVIAPRAVDAEVLSTAWLVADRDLRAAILPNFPTVIDEFVYN